MVTPNRVDAELALGFLAENGIPADGYAEVSQLGGELSAEAGCIVLAEEALADSDLPRLRDMLESQPAWSDLPIVLVATEGTRLASLVERAFPNSANVTLLERPLNPVTLVSAVEVGLRARARQLEVRDLLAKREQALRQRDDFLAMLAHELRNPLAPMRNAVYLQKTLAHPDELLAKTREILERQLGHLSRIVDDLIDVARLERGKIALQRRRLDLSAAVTAAIDSCRPMIQQRNHHVRMSLSPEPLVVDADPVRMEQLLTNLIVNACKFTPPQGEIELRTAAEDGMALVAVRDNGVGIDARLIESIFDPFAQGDQTLERSAGGLGVGLSISRHIAELHGGTLRAESAGHNRGSVFEARFPLASSQAVVSQPPAKSRRASRPRRVLVVEDNRDIRESLRMVLALWGHHVILAATGDEGLALALRERPDVGLIDIGLPGMNGYQIARRIRAAGEPRSMRLLALTGYGQAGDRERAREAGFDGHLIKPVDLDMLNEFLSG